jgi:hypothetical protein
MRPIAPQYTIFFMHPAIPSYVMRNRETRGQFTIAVTVR